MSLRNKYPLASWILSQNQVAPGDIVAFFDEGLQDEVHAEVISLPATAHNEFINCRRLGGQVIEAVNFYDIVLYKVNEGIRSNGSGELVHGASCSCGAKFTSNKNFHLSYCDLR